jgi:hypothetical protein
MIVVCAQTVKMNQNAKWKHPYISITMGMKSSYVAHLAYDHVFSWIAIIDACVVIDNVHYTIYVWIR